MSEKISQYRKVDRLGRIVIPKHICRAANINSDDILRVTYDEYKKTILLEKDERNDYIQKVANDIFKPLHKSLNRSIIIADHNKIKYVYSDSIGLLELVDSDISKELNDYILDDTLIRKSFKKINLTKNYSLANDCYYINLKLFSSNIGCAIIVGDKKINKELLNYLFNQLQYEI